MKGGSTAERGDEVWAVRRSMREDETRIGKSLAT